MNRWTWSIWTINALLQWGLLALVLRKSAWRQHPAFAIYIAFCACKTSALIWVQLFAQRSYSSLNWGMRLIGLPLMIAVLVEVFAAVFRPYSTLPAGTLRGFRIAFASLFLLTSAAAFFFPGSSPGNLINTVMVLNRSASIIFCGSFGVTALFSSYYGIPWQTRTYGIGAGFLLFMSVDLFTSSLASLYGFEMGIAMCSVAMLGYTLALVTWIVYFARPDTPFRSLTLEELQSIRKALDYPAKKAESFRECN